MHYLFLDESYTDDGGRREIVIASWAVEQGRLNSRGEWLNEVFKTPVLEHINSVFEALDALALVASATLEKSLFRTGEIDGTDDVPAMARADNIWSHGVIFTVGTLILEHIRTGRPVDKVSTRMVLGRLTNRDQSEDPRLELNGAQAGDPPVP